MAASVRIEDEAFSDERYEDLAAAAGLADADHARGKMAKLWRQCTLEGAYTLPNQMVLRVLGSRGIEALEVARLGMRVGDTHVRIRGTEGRIEWLGKLRDNGRKGGRPKSSNNLGARANGFTEQKPNGYPSGFPELNPLAPAPAPAPIREEEGAAKPAPKTRVKQSPMPESWKPDRERLNHDAEQKARGRGVDIADALSRLIDWAAAGAVQKADWNAYWRYWLKSARPATPSGYRPTDQPREMKRL